jgi:hypothetical protein
VTAINPIYVGRFSVVSRCRQLSREEVIDLFGSADATASLGAFIVGAGKLWPGFPIYRAWFISVITLADLPGVPPAKKFAYGVTHELIVCPADPNVEFDPDPEQPTTWRRFVCKVAHQFAATDAVALRVAEKCAMAAADGILPLVDVGDEGRAAWARSIDATVEHLMTGGHADGQQVDEVPA